MTVQITILGLGQVGTSIGLALANAKDQVTRIGSDRDSDITRQAVKLGAIDRSVFVLPEAVAKADAVVLAVPPEELRMTMEAIAADLKPGVVVLDTSLTPGQFVQWAGELFPKEDHYVISFTPAFNPQYLSDDKVGLPGAHADLFQGSTIMIGHPVGVDASAIQFAENLARLLGASPLFSDPVEVDGLLSTARLLPQVAAAALTGATVGKPGWLEARKLAGAGYAHATWALDELDGDKSIGDALVAQQTSALHAIDVLVDELLALRALIQSGDAEKLHTRLDQVRGMRSIWLNQRKGSKWDDSVEKTPPLPTIGETLGRLIGLRPRDQRNQRK
jgi:prephenate dehydrogenase